MADVNITTFGFADILKRLVSGRETVVLRCEFANARLMLIRVTEVGTDYFRGITDVSSNVEEVFLFTNLVAIRDVSDSEAHVSRFAKEEVKVHA